MTPVNVCDVSKAILAMVEDAADPADIVVERAETINEDPARCPWVGVYKTGVQYPSRTLGAGNGYRRQRVMFALILQQSHPDSGADCEELLENLVQSVLRTLLNDESLKGNVDVLDEIDVVYQSYGQTADGAQFMQTAIVQFVGVTNVSGG